MHCPRHKRLERLVQRVEKSLAQAADFRGTLFGILTVVPALGVLEIGPCLGILMMRIRLLGSIVGSLTFWSFGRSLYVSCGLFS